MNSNTLSNFSKANKCDAVNLTLQWIHCKDGRSVLCYSTYRQSKPVNFFGNADVAASSSVIDTSVPNVAKTNSNQLVTVWLDGAGKAEEALYAEKYGRDVIGVLSDDKQAVVELVSYSDAEKSLPLSPKEQKYADEQSDMAYDRQEF